MQYIIIVMLVIHIWFVLASYHAIKPVSLTSNPLAPIAVGGIITSTMVFRLTGFSIVCSTVCWGAGEGNHHSSASLRRIHRCPVDPLHEGPITRKMFPFGDVIMIRVNVRKHLWQSTKLKKNKNTYTNVSRKISENRHHQTNVNDKA